MPKVPINRYLLRFSVFAINRIDRILKLYSQDILDKAHQMYELSGNYKSFYDYLVSSSLEHKASTSVGFFPSFNYVIQWIVSKSCKYSLVSPCECNRDSASVASAGEPLKEISQNYL